MLQGSEHFAIKERPQDPLSHPCRDGSQARSLRGLPVLFAGGVRFVSAITRKRSLFGGLRKLLIRLEDFLGHDYCLGHGYHGHAYEARGVREVQRQLRSIPAPFVQ